MSLSTTPADTSFEINPTPSTESEGVLPSTSAESDCVGVQAPGGKKPRSLVAAQEAGVDEELVRRCKAGDEAAFNEIIKRHRNKIFAIAHSVLHNHADAEEIVQDTFIRAHRGLSQFRGDSSLATWLHHICLNLARNRYWYFFRRRRHVTVSLDCPPNVGSKTTIADIVLCDGSTPACEMVTREFSNLVESCMERLEAPHRVILTMRVVLDQPYSEIADFLGIAVGTVKSRIARARKQLRSLIVECSPEFASET